MGPRELGIAGLWAFAPEVHDDPASTFIEAYSAPEFAAAVGRPMSLGQLNFSVTRAGTLRGIHYGDVPPGQAKFVTCLAGAVWDVGVDLRIGSPTFGQWESVLLTAQDHEAVYLGPGLGHGYLCLEDDSILAYVCSEPFEAQREHRVNPIDARLGIAWPRTGRDGTPLEYLIGRHDRDAPSIDAARQGGRLPRMIPTSSWDVVGPGPQ